MSALLSPGALVSQRFVKKGTQPLSVRGRSDLPVGSFGASTTRSKKKKKVLQKLKKSGLVYAKGFCVVPDETS